MQKTINHISILFLTTLFISTNSLAQESHYFTKYFQKRSLEKTSYQRKYSSTERGTITEDLEDGKLELSGTTSGTVDMQELDDFVGYIRANGHELKYKEGFKKLNGQFTFHYDGGSPSSQLIFKDNKIFSTQVWDINGKEQLVKGTGIYKCHSDEFDEEHYTEYKDSLLVLEYAIRLKGDTIYGKIDKMAEPKEGLQNFLQHIVKVVKYPVIARIAGKEGRAFIQFIVDEKGELTDFRPMSKEGYRFETKVINKLEAFPNWNPAVYKGRPVKTRFVLPIVYKLAG